ncbi:helix-turn-helix transcriptional regulator [Thiobacillus sp. 63-78]|uniref:helix-turn-helix domain-containing protein n=1 Tax=Thiobacillus sp. 63-78 TaxID=1895859 RepID=UPI0025F7A6F8|nr:helix-turn-helix transcriptional regulator [Thiobacillus sp. 63-78]
MNPLIVDGRLHGNDMVNLTEFGIVVRKARLDAKVTQREMAASLGVTSAFLSNLEKGRSKIPEEWVARIETFFKDKGIELPNLFKLADVANRSISLAGMNPQKAMMLAAFARTSFTRKQMEKFSQLLGEIKEN